MSLIPAAIALALFAAPAGVPPPERPSGRLVVGLHPPERMAVVDVASGRTVERRLPGGALCHGPLLASGGRIVFSGNRGDDLTVNTIGARLRGPATMLGATREYFPSSEGRLWLVGRSSVREVTAAGRTTFRSRHRTPRQRTVGSFARGLLLERRGEVSVWNPRRGTIRRLTRGVFVVAASDRRAAVCGWRCQSLRLVGPGAAVVAPAPAGLSFSPEGAFAADGSLLAVQAHEAESEGARIALVETASGSAELVPEARADPHAPVAWSRSGWLYYRAPTGRLMAYRPGASGPLPLPVRLRGNVNSLAALD